MIAKISNPRDEHVITDVSEIPCFTSEEEERAFWATHSVAECLIERAEPIPPDWLPAPRTRPVAVRFDAGTLARLRALARRKGKGYQTLLKEFVIERLYEEEKREGIIGDAPVSPPRRSRSRTRTTKGG